MKRFKYFLFGYIAFSILIFTLNSCKINNDYNAVFYDDATNWISDEFLVENKVEFEGTNYPKTLVFVIKNDDRFQEIFKNEIEDLNINFEKQFLAIYTFSTVYHRKYNLVNIIDKDAIITINFSMEKKNGIGDASMPYQRWFVIKLDNIDFTSIVFKEL